MHEFEDVLLHPSGVIITFHIIMMFDTGMPSDNPLQGKIVFRFSEELGTVATQKGKSLNIQGYC